MDELLSTRDAARLLGVGATSVKRWADAGMLRCVRTPGGHRRFSRAAVEALFGPPSPDDDGSSWMDRWMAVLLTRRGTEPVLDRLRHERDARGSWWRVAEALGALVAEIGARWERGALTVVQEHIASERLARALSAVAESQLVPADAPAALLMTAEGEDHTLGLSLVELCLREAQWATVWSGRQSPVDQVGAHLDAHRDVRLVAVSASIAMDDRRALARQAGALAELCRPRGVQLLLGGAGAWPEPAPYGHRIHDLGELAAALELEP